LHHGLRQATISYEMAGNEPIATLLAGGLAFWCSSPSELQECNFGEGAGEDRCITSFHGKTGPVAETTTRRSSSPRKVDLPERRSGSAPSVRFASNASTMPSDATNVMGYGVA